MTFRSIIALAVCILVLLGEVGHTESAKQNIRRVDEMTANRCVGTYDAFEYMFSSRGAALPQSSGFDDSRAYWVSELDKMKTDRPDLQFVNEGQALKAKLDAVQTDEQFDAIRSELIGELGYCSVTWKVATGDVG